MLLSIVSYKQKLLLVRGASNIVVGYKIIRHYSFYLFFLLATISARHILEGKL